MNYLAGSILSLFSVLGYSIISIYIGRTARKLGAFWTGLSIQVLDLPLNLLLLPFFPFKFSFDKYLLAIAIFGISVPLTYTLYSKSLSIGPASVVAAILRIGNLITFILAIFFLQEKITLFKILGGLLVILGVIVVSLHLGELLKRKVKLLTLATPLVLLQAVISGVMSILLGLGSKEFNGFSAALLTRFFIVPSYLLLSLTRKKPRGNLFVKSWRVLLFIAAVDVAAFILYNQAVYVSEISFITITQSTVPVATAIIAALLFRERLDLFQKFGILLVVIGTMILNLG